MMDIKIIAARTRAIYCLDFLEEATRSEYNEPKKKKKKPRSSEIIILSDQKIANNKLPWNEILNQNSQTLNLVKYMR